VPARITAFLFDLGDTLWHFPDMPPMEKIDDEMTNRFVRLLKVWDISKVDDPDVITAYIRSEIQNETRKASLTDCISPNYGEVCKEAANRRGVEITSDQGEELWQSWNLGGKFLGRRLFPDSLDLLYWLRDHGYRLGCVTNRGYGGRRFQDEMQEDGLDELFEVVSVSADIGYLKPHPRIFVHAMEEMGLTPQETVMVGDSLRADVGGSKALGMVAIWRKLSSNEVTSGPPRYPDQVLGETIPEPDFTVDSMADIKNLSIFSDA